VDVSKLTLDDELFLVRRWQLEGHAPSRDRVIEANMQYVQRLVAKVARAAGRVDLADDIYAEGCLALLLSLDSGRFDPERGLRVITYAAPRVRAAIQATLLKAESPLSGRAGPNYRKVVRDYKADPERVARTRTNCAIIECLEAGAGVEHAEGHSVSLETPEAIAIDGEARDDILRAVSGLNDRQRRLVMRKFFGPRELSNAEIGAIMGVSRERVRALLKAALGALRERLSGANDP